MQQGGGTTRELAALAAWLALALIGALRAAGLSVSTTATLCVLVATPISFAAAVEAASSFWRGPAIVAFTRDEAIACSPPEAAYVRSVAMLRGTMGGAGYLHPRRLAFPAASWAAAAVAGAAVLSDGILAFVGPWPVAGALAAAFAAYVLPARPFFYRETTGGGLVVSPPRPAYGLKRRAEYAAARARGEAVEETPTPAPTPAPTVGLTVSEAGQRDRSV